VITCPAARISTGTTKCLWCHRLHPIWIKPDQLKDEVLVDPEIIMEKIVIDPTKRPRLGYFIRGNSDDSAIYVFLIPLKINFTV
jgi:hypothetical protein